MKKAITILAVLIVLVGAVFAAETHKIQIKSVVSQVDPIFQLSFVSGGTGSATTNSDKNDVDLDIGSYKIDGEQAIAVADISKNSITVKFEANLASDVKLARAATYDLQFVANPLVGEATSYAVSPITTGSGVSYDNITATRTTMNQSWYDQHETYGTFVSEKVALASVVATAAAEDGAPHSEKLTQTTKVIFGTENVTKGTLGEFTVVYPEDNAAPADTYRAYIEMNITAD